MKSSCCLIRGLFSRHIQVLFMPIINNIIPVSIGLVISQDFLLKLALIFLFTSLSNSNVLSFIKIICFIFKSPWALNSELWCNFSLFSRQYLVLDLLCTFFIFALRLLEAHQPCNQMNSSSFPRWPQNL